MKRSRHVHSRNVTPLPPKNRTRKLALNICCLFPWLEPCVWVEVSCRLCMCYDLSDHRHDKYSPVNPGNRSTAFDVVFVLFCYSPIQAGGLAFTVRRLSNLKGKKLCNHKTYHIIHSLLGIWNWLCSGHVGLHCSGPPALLYALSPTSVRSCQNVQLLHGNLAV